MDIFSSYLAVFIWISNVERRMALKKEKWRRNTDFSLHQFHSILILPLTPVWDPLNIGHKGKQERKCKRLWSNSSPNQEKFFKLQMLWACHSRHAEFCIPIRHQVLLFWGLFQGPLYLKHFHLCAHPISSIHLFTWLTPPYLSGLSLNAISSEVPQSRPPSYRLPRSLANPLR